MAKKTKLQQAIHKAAYESLEKLFPEVIDAIREALADGISPRKMGDWVTRIFPNSITAASVECAAEYMRDNPGLGAKSANDEGSH